MVFLTWNDQFFVSVFFLSNTHICFSIFQYIGILRGYICFQFTFSHFSYVMKLICQPHVNEYMCHGVCVCDRGGMCGGVCVFRVYVLLFWESISPEINLNPQENDFFLFLDMLTLNLYLPEKHTLYTYVKL